MRTPACAQWVGGVHEGIYLSRDPEQVEAELDELGAATVGLTGAQGYEMSGGAARRPPPNGDRGAMGNGGGSS